MIIHQGDSAGSLAFKNIFNKSFNISTTSKLTRKQSIEFLNQSNSFTNIKNIKLSNNNYKCPSECICLGLSIDCSNRRLTRVPKYIPFNVIKV